jgi:hypothetical protein
LALLARFCEERLEDDSRPLFAREFNEVEKLKAALSPKGKQKRTA